MKKIVYRCTCWTEVHALKGRPADLSQANWQEGASSQIFMVDVHFILHMHGEVTQRCAGSDLQFSHQRLAATAKFLLQRVVR